MKKSVSMKFDIMIQVLQTFWLIIRKLKISIFSTTKRDYFDIIQRTDEIHKVQNIYRKQ